MAELRVVRPHERDVGTAQTPGLHREAGIAGSTVGAKHIWVGHVTMEPGMKSGAHHHGPVESGIYIVSGHARFRFGDKLQESVEVGPGDFVFVPPEVVHQEMHAGGDDEPVVAIVSRNGQENIVVNVEMPEAEE